MSYASPVQERRPREIVSVPRRNVESARGLVVLHAALLALTTLASLFVIAAPAASAIGLTHPDIVLLFYGATLAELSLRWAFLSVACKLADRIGSGAGSRGKDVIAALLVPVLNLYLPFAIVRDLVRASAPDDLPPARRLVEARGGFRESAFREELITPRRVAAPVVVVWQVAVALGIVGMYLDTRLWAALLVVGYAAQAWVFSRLAQRFRARLAHVKLLSASSEAG